MDVPVRHRQFATPRPANDSHRDLSLTTDIAAATSPVHETTRSEPLAALTNESAAADGGGLMHICSICKRGFPLRKTLNRHIKAKHQASLKIRCTYCDKYCARKDILDRHIQTQHLELGGNVRCDICAKHVRRRCLDIHRASAACQKVAVQGTTTASAEGLIERWQVVEYDEYDTLSSIPSCLPAVVNALRLSAELWTKLKPFGKGLESQDLWLQRRSRSSFSPEVLELNGLVYRTLYQALWRSDADRDEHLADAVAILLVTTSLIDGFYECKAHEHAIVWLAEHQVNTIFGGDKEAFINTVSSEAFHPILAGEVGDSEVRRCGWLLAMGIRLMKMCAVELVWSPIRYSNVTPQRRVDLHKEEHWVQRYGHLLPVLADLASSIGSRPCEKIASERDIDRLLTIKY